MRTVLRMLQLVEALRMRSNLRDAEMEEVKIPQGEFKSEERTL